MGCYQSSHKKEKISQVPEKQTKDKKKEAKLSPTSARSRKELQELALKAHNSYRSKHGVPSLKLSKELSEMAQKWAEHLASIRTLKHSPCKLQGESVGENIAYKWTSSGGDFSGQEATDNWYNEIEQYDFNASRMTSNTGHFTQVVWKASKELGVGRACANDGSFFIVANYRPAGNFIGKFQENVFKPKK